MAALWWSVSGCLYLWCAQKPCRRLALISCASCSSVLGEAVAPGRGRLLQVFINKQHFNKHVRALSRVVSSRNAEAVRHTGGGGACCGRQKARSFTEQAGFFCCFFLSFQIHTRDCRCQRFCSHAHVDWTRDRTFVDASATLLLSFLSFYPRCCESCVGALFGYVIAIATLKALSLLLSHAV